MLRESTSPRVGRQHRRIGPSLLLFVVLTSLLFGFLGVILDTPTSATCAPTQGDPNAADGDSSPPVVTEVKAYLITPTTATITWTLDEPSTGQVEYGPTLDYGDVSIEESSFDYCTHIQQITGLEPNQTYHFRVISQDMSGNRTESADFDFTTPATGASPSCAPLPPAGRATGATEIGSSQANGGLYGTGLNGDSKSNRTIAPGRDVQRMAVRWRATTTSELKAIVVQWRTSLVEPDYSGGNLGTYRITVQTDDGSPANHPSGDILATMTLRMMDIEGIDGEGHKIRRHEFDDPPSIQEGQLYHLVFENIDSSPRKNYIAVNHLFAFDRLEPRQPLFSDRDLAVLGSQRARGDQWEEDPRHTPNIDLEYANGAHDGQSYQNDHDEHYALIGGDNQARERFAVSGWDRQVTSMWVRVNRQRGDDPLTMILEAADGSFIEEHEVPRSNRLGKWELGGQGDTGDWVGVPLDRPRTLEEGETYCLRLTAPSSTLYAAVSLLSRSAFDINGEYMKSYRFDDGLSEKSADGGRSWVSVDESWADYLDLQFYLTQS